MVQGHFPPYAKPEAAYDSARLYRETSEIAAAQDAKLDGKPDPVNAPTHYALAGGEAIDVIEAVAATISDPVQATLTSHALKYLMRWSRKGGITDLLKCRWYLARLIGKVESANQEAALAVTPSEPDYSDNAYLARFGPNTLAPEAPRHPMAAEADRILKGQPGDML